MKFRQLAITGIIVGLGCIAPAAHAGFYSGNQLLDVCTAEKSSPSYVENTYECVAYVAGAVDAFNTTREVNKLKSCIPAKVTLEKLKSATVDYLRANPKKRDESASALVFAATRKAWPCGKTK
ncbi:Rap1a/Tai family immunity protein [Sphingobium sp.]|uniref:Rap1a/Tai family immunity protein n=1 Tax=Sphingobium sp. TaxID=1912891 RepID=UPI003BB7D340